MKREWPIENWNLEKSPREINHGIQRVRSQHSDLLLSHTQTNFSHIHDMHWDCTFIIPSGPCVPALTSPTSMREIDCLLYLRTFRGSMCSVENVKYRTPPPTALCGSIMTAVIEECSKSWGQMQKDWREGAGIYKVSKFGMKFGHLSGPLVGLLSPPPTTLHLSTSTIMSALSV